MSRIQSVVFGAAFATLTLLGSPPISLDVVSTAAFAEDGAPLAATAELVKRKGFKTIVNHGLWALFDLQPNAAALNVQAEEDDLVSTQTTYPKGFLPTFIIFVEPRTGSPPIILATAATAKPGTAYAFLTDLNGRLYKVASGRTKGDGWIYSSGRINQETQAIFEREVRVWSSESMRKGLSQAPDQKR